MLLFFFFFLQQKCQLKGRLSCCKVGKLFLIQSLLIETSPLKIYPIINVLETSPDWLERRVVFPMDGAGVGPFLTNLWWMAVLMDERMDG